jgi:Na+-translocating ferredoxin:NAD+ oxidoreductase RnfG subunit
MNKLRIITLLVAIISLAAGYILLPDETVDESLYLHEVAPNFKFSAKSGVPPVYKSGRDIVAFNTYDISPSIRGYAGPIKILLALNAEGEIKGIKILSHSETKNYVHYMISPEYLNQFIGKNINDPFEIERDIDGISRATESVRALADTIRESSRKVAFHVYGLKVRGRESKRHFGTGWILYLMLFMSALALYAATRKSRRLLRIRDICMILGVLIIGLYLATPFSILHIFNLLLMRLSSSALWYVVLFSTIFSIAIAGRFYCGWLCPFGALAEFIGRIASVKWKIPSGTDDRWRITKYFLLILIVAVVLISRQIEYGNYETYVTLFSFHGHLFAWALTALMLIINIRVQRFWCRYLCPVAALTGILSMKDSRYVSGKDCPMANKKNPLISECIRCNRCFKIENTA